jgi:hypothetical protein
MHVVNSSWPWASGWPHFSTSTHKYCRNLRLEIHEATLFGDTLILGLLSHIFFGRYYLALFWDWLWLWCVSKDLVAHGTDTCFDLCCCSHILYLSGIYQSLNMWFLFLCVLVVLMTWLFISQSYLYVINIKL